MKSRSFVRRDESLSWYANTYFLAVLWFEFYSTTKTGKVGSTLARKIRYATLRCRKRRANGVTH